jgi:hypothetical protein
MTLCYTIKANCDKYMKVVLSPEKGDGTVEVTGNRVEGYTVVSLTHCLHG